MTEETENELFINWSTMGDETLLVSFFQTLLRHQETQQVEEALFPDATWKEACSPEHCLKSSIERGKPHTEGQFCIPSGKWM